jgi:5-methylcytosine-specific restriction endonuclease McrA
MGKHQALGTSRWKQLRLRILMRDGYECAYCGETADTVDHVISRASGGDMWDAENLVAACKRCNSMKGDRPAKKAVFSGASSTPPVFSEVISPRGQTSTVIYDDFGQIEPDDN